jgi:peptide/nickel transport system permease protein
VTVSTVQDHVKSLMGNRVVEASGSSLTRETWRRVRANRMAVVGGCIVVAFVLVAILAPLLAPYNPRDNSWFNQIRPGSIPGPSAAHWFGLDESGRDLLSRVIFGARSSLVIGVVSLLIGGTLGTVVGLLAGAFPGWIDSLIMRFTDVLLAVPSLLLALSVAAVMGQSQTAVMVAVAVPNVPLFARMLRSSMLSERQKDYVSAATSVGITRKRLVLSHIVPNSVGPMIVQGTLALATAVIDAAALSFLGLGSSDPTVPEWGRMLASAQRYTNVAIHIAIFPGVMIMLTALGFNLFGEALREALDPKLRR